MLESDLMDAEKADRGCGLGSHLLYIDNPPRISAKPIGDAAMTIGALSTERPVLRISAPIEFFEDAVLLSHQWRTERRIEHAKSLLRDNRESHAGIAVTRGFANQSHLANVFARQLGTSPGQWRTCIAA